jgi:hypothetical protein
VRQLTVKLIVSASAQFVIACALFAIGGLNSRCRTCATRSPEWLIAIVGLGPLQASRNGDSGSKPKTVRAMRDMMIAYDRANATG